MEKTDRQRPDRFGASAFLIYLGLSAIFFGRALSGVFSTIHHGKGQDPALNMWYMVWWPHAIRHHLNPFFTDLLWAPWGFNVAWSACIPLPSIAASPLTLAFGPVFAFNTLSLMFPALTAWAAFILCRHLVGQYSIPLLGGYIYGFSPYILGQLVSGHIHMTAAFIVPLVVYLTLIYLEGGLPRARFITLMSILFVVQFLVTTEIFATSFFFGAITLAVAMVVTPEARPRLYDLIKSIALSLAIAIVVLAPYLFYIVLAGPFGGPLWRSVSLSADIANAVIPGSPLFLRQVFEFGRNDEWMPQSFVENGIGYIGLPLIAIAIVFGYSRWRDPVGKLIAIVMATIYLLCLGPRLHFAGRTLFGLPWKLFEHLPLLNDALPVRFTMYLFLALAIVTALWLNAASFSPLGKLAVAVVTIVFMLPNLSAGYWVSAAKLPGFFANGDYAKYLAPHEVIVPLPYGGHGEDMLWQASSHMYFAMAAGRIPKSPEYQTWPIMRSFGGTSIPDEGEQLKAFMAAHRATTVILSDDAPDRAQWLSIMPSLGVQPLEIGGVSLYRVPATTLEKYRGLSAPEMEARMDAARFDTLLSAAHRYIESHRDFKSLTPLEAMRQGLLPANWVSDTDGGVSTAGGLWLGPQTEGQVGVGVVGSYESLKPIIEKYASDATAVYFPYPRKLQGRPTGDTFMRKLVMTFDRDGMARAAIKSDAASHSFAAH